MRMTKKNMAMSIFWIILGAVLLIMAYTGHVEDERFSGMACCFFGMGILQILRQLKYRRNTAYREKVDIASKDERYRFLGEKAWAWAGRLFIMISSLAGIGLMIFAKESRGMVYQTLFSGACLMMVLYWVCYLFLSRKY